ncbi:class II poly(R)-hydroxyalkanoic acid synthase [Kocuria dechangensis]|uniref:Class II poly(R)-hydroxyalkanoic acid synthase n=1 Tax=Kocuria dechangensis TaxID=1176249 RepID=A0A917LPC5_9MICC|nr:alpha/beta fold hydrolase [Kocuria dechangensis]GGG48621.1 class II poly(R)-hydroxyalkanoic acid synthase [Kocuria dechangensis]
MSTETELPDEEQALEAAADAALGGELLSTLDPLLLMESLARTLTPAGLFRVSASLAQQIPLIALGLQPAELPAKDLRFADATFGENQFYRRIAAVYSVWEKEMMALVEEGDVDWRTRERARMAMSAITTALAPTNTLPGNPEALRLAVSTGGMSLVSGLMNFVRDLTTNRGYPAQVDKSAFEVGRNLAVTPGWVVHRTEMFELIHYTPTEAQVGSVPMLLLPPPVNKYYFWDLAPGRSMIEYAVGRGVDMWTIVWRDPREDNGDWGVESYLTACREAVDVVLEVTGSDDLHMFGDCSGGMLLTMLLAHQAAIGERRIRTGTMGVTVADFGEPGGIGATASDRGLEKVRERAEKKEVISADDIAKTFAWMRPNDLVWRYLVDEWLLGKKPPVFDIMYWNSDGQGMPAQFAYDMTRMSLDNSLIRPGGMTVLGTPLDLGAVDVDTYHVAGLTDHISPWKGCYAGARAIGGDATFVLTPTGHVQSIIYPMGKRRAAFWSGPKVDVEAEAWHAAAQRTDDSWWEHWVDWVLERSDGTREAPAEPGNSKYQPIVPAPGRYVHGE